MSFCLTSSSTANNYEEIGFIGEGTYGTVFKARDLVNEGQSVAIKKVNVALYEDGVPPTLIREISLLKQLEMYEHPNVVRYVIWTQFFFSLSLPLCFSCYLCFDNSPNLMSHLFSILFSFSSKFYHNFFILPILVPLFFLYPFKRMDQQVSRYTFLSFTFLFLISLTISSLIFH